MSEQQGRSQPIAPLKTSLAPDPVSSTTLIKSIRDFELMGRRVLMRLDFNCPLSAPDADGHRKVEDDNRIVESLPTIKYLLDQKGGYNTRRLLEAMATADGADAAFRQALGMPYADFERHLLAALARAAG